MDNLIISHIKFEDDELGSMREYIAVLGDSIVAIKTVRACEWVGSWALDLARTYEARLVWENGIAE
jgi:hypothetical protein